MDFVVEDRGLLEYGEAYALQKETLAAVAEKRRPNTLILVEHPPVYTFGRKSDAGPRPDTDSVFEVERGGEATYHNPGQLVGYPIFLLEDSERDIHRFLRGVEQALIGVLADFSVLGEVREGATGVWVEGQQRKIASIGIAVSRWVTYHGFALNVCNDLKGFKKITPCGFSAEVMTSIQESSGTPALMQTAKEKTTHHFKKQFS